MAGSSPAVKLCRVRRSERRSKHRAVNLRGTGSAACHWEMRSITAPIDGVVQAVTLRVSTLPAYLLAKTHAAHGRGLPNDWYDIAYVLLRNDDGGPGPAGRRVREQFQDDLVGAMVNCTVGVVGELRRRGGPGQCGLRLDDGRDPSGVGPRRAGQRRRRCRRSVDRSARASRRALVKVAIAVPDSARAPVSACGGPATWSSPSCPARSSLLLPCS